MADIQHIFLEHYGQRGAFNQDFDQDGSDRPVAGMVGSGTMQNVMILTKWQLLQ